MKKYAAAGVDVEGTSARHPPKVQLISKYERRTDRRTFGERKNLFQYDKDKEAKKELIKPPAKKRETWIKDKGAEEHKRSVDYAEDGDEDRENQPSQSHDEEQEAPAEVEAQEE